MAHNPRYSNGSLRRRNRRWLAQQGFACVVCHLPIDYSLPAGDPWAFELDECVPVSRYWERAYNVQQGCWCGPYRSPEEAALDRSNGQAAHRICNERKGNRIVGNGESENEIRHSREL